MDRGKRKTIRIDPSRRPPVRRIYVVNYARPHAIGERSYGQSNQSPARPVRVNRRLLAAYRFMRLRLGLVGKSFGVTAYVVLALILIMASLTDIFFAKSNFTYGLSSAAQLLINKPDPALAKTLIYNSGTDAFTINAGSLAASSRLRPANILVGQPGSGLYSATLSKSLTAGITVHDNAGNIGFSLTPQFGAGAGQSAGGHLIYPLGNGSIQAVYTPKATSLAEDLIINKPVGNRLSFPYVLKLPTGMQSFRTATGGVAIESNGHILFGLSAPTVTESNGATGGKRVKNAGTLLLKNNHLILLATGLQHLTYPIDIDPSITINSSINFSSGNDEGGNAVTTNQVSTGGVTGGAFNNLQTTCPSGWTLNSSTYCTDTTSLPTTTQVATSVVYNGYIYEIGGCTTATGCTTTLVVPTATVHYTLANANGTPGSWIPTTSLPTAIAFATSVVYNGYVYVIGGDSGTGTYVATVEYAPLNPNGGIITQSSCASGWTLYNSTWCYDTTSLPAVTGGATSIVYNGYVYEIGGCSSTCPVTTVDYAPLNSKGGLGTQSSCPSGWTLYGSTWCSDTTSLLAATYFATSVVYNGYVYEIGGYNGTAAITNVDYAPINANGSLGAWTSTTSLPTATYHATSVVYNGYVYEIGGYNGSAAIANVYYAPINNNGTLGSWTTTTSLPAATYHATSVVYNGYVYEIGGETTLTVNTVDYVQIAPAGWVSSPDSTDINTWGATASLLSAGEAATSVIYSGYIYEIGGENSSNAAVAAVDYASLTPNGNLGAWTATTSLPAVTYGATSVVYNGYVYILGGNNGSAATATVDYAPLSSSGGLGTQSSCPTGWTLYSSTWCYDTTSLPAATRSATSVAYNGYVYEIGGENGSNAAVAAVDYASIKSNGSLGTWTATTSLPAGTYYATSVVYNGYVYEIGGCGSTCPVATVDYGLINNGGPGAPNAWTQITSGTGALQTATYGLGAVAYNGYLYAIGGYNGTSYLATVEYAPLQSIPRIGNYSMLVNVGNGVNVTPLSIITYGSNTGNPGLGSPYSGLGGITETYESASTTCSTFNTASTVDSSVNQLNTPYKLTVSSDGCGNATSLGEYVWIHFKLDDSQTATFPDIYGNHTTITGFRIFYHPAVNMRLRGGATFNNNSLHSLDAPPTVTQ